MATTQEIIDLVVKPMAVLNYKVPTDDEDVALFVEAYRKVLSKFAVHLIDEAMPAVFEKHSYTPKPADIVKAINALPRKQVSATGLIRLTKDEPGFWAWVDYKFPNTKWRFEQGQFPYDQIHVSTPFPPQEKTDAAS